MSDPRYIPRSYAVEQHLYGLVPDVEWNEPRSRSDGIQLVAAQLQHQICCAVRKELRRRGMSVRDLAEREGLNIQRTTRVLRGVTIMRLEDLAVFDGALGLRMAGGPISQQP